jgi:hypothetical protein
MRILELEKKFESEETLNDVLEELAEDFEKVDYWANCRKNNLTDNPEEVDKALNELSGCLSNLRTALGIAESQKKNREVRNKNQIRIKTENEGVKYVDTKATTQASAEIAPYRRIRNIVRAYYEAVQTQISTLQSILKDLNKDYNLEQ